MTASEPRISATERARLLRAITRTSVLVACSLIVAKTVAAGLTGSAAVFGALVDSGVDAIASLVTLVAVRHALSPADHDHRFGHGKAEQLAGLMQSLFVVASAILLGVQALGRLSDPQPVASPVVGIGVMGFAIVVTAALVLAQRRVIRLTGSTAIRADLMHYAGDVLMHAAVAAGLAAWQLLGWMWVDGALGLLIAVWLLYGAARIGWEAMQGLMDRELPPADRERIVAIVRCHTEVLDLHDLRTRLSGSTRIIQMHLELDGGLLLRDAHRITVEVASEVRDAFPGSEVLIHEDPAGIVEPKTRDPRPMKSSD